MNSGGKRERTMAQIDIFFLLNQRKILTKKEFLAVLPRASYLSYVQAFYKRKFSKIFTSCCESRWFQERYIRRNAPDGAAAVGRLRSFLENAHTGTDGRIFDYCRSNILVKNIPESMHYDDLLELAKKCLYFREFNVYQLEQRRSFGRVGIISVDGDPDEATKFMESVVNRDLKISFEVARFDEIKVRRCNLAGRNDLDTVKSLFARLCEKYRTRGCGEDRMGSDLDALVEEQAAKSGNPLDFYITALRKTFFFCFYCCRQYDTVYELRLLCGDWHISVPDVEESEDMKKVFFRKYEIYLFQESFDFLKTKTESSELDGFVLRKDADRFKCDCCIKMFSTAEYAKNHIRNKHPDVVEKIKAKIDVHDLSVDSIDFFMFSCLSGTDDFYPLTFLDLSEKVEGVRYLDRVFSGEVVIERKRG